MKKKILFVANSDFHLELCYLAYLEYFQKKGYEVHLANNTDLLLPYATKKIKIPISRTPFHWQNIKAIWQLRKVIAQEKYSLISCSTPMGGVVARLASAKAIKLKQTKLIYTAHGFHFFKGCPWLNYLIYYPVERYLIKYTDVLITINEEDYKFAQKHFKTVVKYIKGIGFNENRLKTKLTLKEQFQYRQHLGLSKNDFVILYIAEISKRKRQKYLIKTMAQIKDKNIKLLLAGRSNLSSDINSYIQKFHLEDRVKVLGFRPDIANLLDIADLVISVSKQEGLPLNIMEAMYKEKPIIVTDCRGNRDLITNKVNGLVVPLNDAKALITAINYLKENYSYAKTLGKNNQPAILEYSINNILKEYVKVYEQLLGKEV